MFQPEARLLIIVKHGPNTQEIAGSSPRASFENPYFRVADLPSTIVGFHRAPKSAWNCVAHMRARGSWLRWQLHDPVSSSMALVFVSYCMWPWLSQSSLCRACWYCHLAA